MMTMKCRPESGATPRNRKTFPMVSMPAANSSTSPLPPRGPSTPTASKISCAIRSSTRTAASTQMQSWLKSPATRRQPKSTTRWMGPHPQQTVLPIPPRYQSRTPLRCVPGRTRQDFTPQISTHTPTSFLPPFSINLPIRPDSPISGDTTRPPIGPTARYPPTTKWIRKSSQTPSMPRWCSKR